LLGKPRPGLRMAGCDKAGGPSIRLEPPLPEIGSPLAILRCWPSYSRAVGRGGYGSAEADLGQNALAREQFGAKAYHES